MRQDFRRQSDGDSLDALREQHGIELEKNKIVQAEPIKQFGSFEVKAKLGYEVSGTINVLVTEKK